jgi:hypothetical protein
MATRVSVRPVGNRSGWPYGLRQIKANHHVLEILEVSRSKLVTPLHS